jgi:hypothetical protein
MDIFIEVFWCSEFIPRENLFFVSVSSNLGTGRGIQGPFRRRLRAESADTPSPTAALFLG